MLHIAYLKKETITGYSLDWRYKKRLEVHWWLARELAQLLKAKRFRKQITLKGVSVYSRTLIVSTNLGQVAQ